MYENYIFIYIIIYFLLEKYNLNYVVNWYENINIYFKYNYSIHKFWFYWLLQLLQNINIIYRKYKLYNINIAKLCILL